MSSRKDPWKQIGRPAYEGIHGMPFDLEKRAVRHELNRQKAISRLMIDLYCITASGLIDATHPVGISGAKSQSLSGSREGNTEAAHCIPRQLLIGTVKVQDVLKHRFPERSLALDAMFGETDILPANFNKADSRAEKNGLAEAFRAGCQNVVQSGANGKMDYKGISLSVIGAYAAYREIALKAFRESRKELQERVNEIRNSRIQHSIRTKESEKWEQQLAITRIYSTTLQDSEGPNEVLEMGIVNGIVKVYSMINQP